MSATLHRAQLEDFDRIDHLVAAFHTEFGLEISAEHRRSALTPLLEGSPHGVAYLIGPARAPIGYIAVSFGWSIEFAGKDGFVDEFYIRPSVRRRGLGREALARLQDILAKDDLRALHMEVDRDDSRVQALYQARGFSKRDRYVLMTQTIRPVSGKG